MGDNALENKIVSRFMGIWGEAAFSRFRFNFWFVRACK